MSVQVKLSPCGRDSRFMAEMKAAEKVDPIPPAQLIENSETFDFTHPPTPGQPVPPGGAEALLNKAARVENDNEEDGTITPLPPDTWSREIGQAYREANTKNDVLPFPSACSKEERKKWIEEVQGKGFLFPDAGHVTPQMAGKVLNIKRPKDCTTPQVTKEDHRGVEDALTWYKSLLGLLEWELQAQAKDLTGPPKPALFKTDIAQKAWWADRVPPRALELISVRYDSAPHASYLTRNETRRAYKEYGVKNVLYDPFLAPFWAVNWRIKTLQAISEGRGHDVSDNDLQKLNVPLEPFIYWIALEMRHNLLLMAESNRMDEFNGRIDNNTTPSMWVSGNLIDRVKYSPQEPEQPLGVYSWNPDRDAMFRYVTLTGKGYYITNKQQAFWCDYAPQPGLKGYGPAPKFENYRDFLGTLASVYEGWNNWNRDSYMDPKERFLDPEPSQKEEVKAVTLWAEPTLLYCPEKTLLQAGKPAFEKQAISPCGPGTGKRWPAGITMGGNTRPDQARKFTRAKNTHTVLSRPVNLSITSFEPANEQDKDDMRLGCTQGCGREGTFRYRSEPDLEPKHHCPFCNKTWGNRLMASTHLDTCKDKPPNWFRTEEQRQHLLPPLPSTSCGHSFCSFCANVSMITAPPYAYCTVCGEEARCIRITDGAVIGVLSRPPKEDKPDQTYEAPLEVWREKNPLNHHRNRYALLTGRFPAKVSTTNWDTVYAVKAPKKRLSSPKPGGTMSSDDLVGTVAKLQNNLKRADQVKDALHKMVRPCHTKNPINKPFNKPSFLLDR